jgi:hypothetical protein
MRWRKEGDEWQDVAPEASAAIEPGRQEMQDRQMPDLAPAFERLCQAARGLPEVEETTWFGTPSLKVRGKGFARVKDAGTVVLMVDLEEKAMLFEAAPDIYFETDHYKGWPAMLVRLEAISDEELRHRITKAWSLKAPKTLAKRLTEPNSKT